MTKISIFENPEFGTLRTMEMPDGQIGFVGKDVATVLGYSKPLDALQRHVDEDDSVKHGLIPVDKGDDEQCKDIATFTFSSFCQTQLNECGAKVATPLF